MKILITTLVLLIPTILYALWERKQYLKNINNEPTIDDYIKVFNKEFFEFERIIGVHFVEASRKAERAIDGFVKAWNKPTPS